MVRCSPHPAGLPSMPLPCGRREHSAGCRLCLAAHAHRAPGSSCWLQAAGWHQRWPSHRGTLHADADSAGAQPADAARDRALPPAVLPAAGGRLCRSPWSGAAERAGQHLSVRRVCLPSARLRKAAVMPVAWQAPCAGRQDSVSGGARRADSAARPDSGCVQHVLLAGEHTPLPCCCRCCAGRALRMWPAWSSAASSCGCIGPLSAWPPSRSSGAPRGLACWGWLAGWHLRSWDVRGYAVCVLVQQALQGTGHVRLLPCGKQPMRWQLLLSGLLQHICCRPSRFTCPAARPGKPADAAPVAQDAPGRARPAPGVHHAHPAAVLRALLCVRAGRRVLLRICPVPGHRRAPRAYRLRSQGTPARMPDIIAHMGGSAAAVCWCQSSLLLVWAVRIWHCPEASSVACCWRSAACAAGPATRRCCGTSAEHALLRLRGICQGLSLHAVAASPPGSATHAGGRPRS